MSLSKPMLVAAIDFGTTYSSWAFSLLHEYENDPTQISAKQWQGHESTKGPTTVLIKPDGRTLEAFGFEAETRYAELIDEEEHDSYYFFKRFKMKLWNQKIERDMLIEDENSRHLSAKTVFALAIKWLKDDLWRVSNDRISGTIRENEIHWVLTVPAIWDNAAKQFMREAATLAGIEEKKLTVALEPEAASLFCRHLPIERSGNETSLGKMKAGQRYLVLDAGGGTIDITVHEVMQSMDVKELFKASGGAWGGTKVDEDFKGFINDIAGFDAIADLKQKHLDDFIDLFRRFENKKRSISPDKDSKTVIPLPLSLCSLIEKRQGRALCDLITDTVYASSVSMTNEKVKIDASVARQFFDSSVSSTIEHLKNILSLPVNMGVEAILMVGGFSESPMLQHAIGKEFGALKRIVPRETSLAVLKGAVIFGHNPNAITERISKLTYGVSMVQTFDAAIHVSSKKKCFDGVDKCVDLFDRHVKIGQKLKVGEAQYKERYHAVELNQKAMYFPIFTTYETNPMYTTNPGCKQIGNLEIPLSGSGKDRWVTVRFIFGGTEIDVEATEDSTGKVQHLKIDFLV
ncbi:heat shock 70 kDa protein 12A-like [Mya arenaria]|uniref:heat shock 70 kDa protein 12A-like n=1 Tax=Mya arenaria TaxID=6604 RepID=UPI0022E8818E|nr:heat shock 70 kDa protein 12A-like [Mya arenaria]XP_052799505.1 heat shock 70 kDa protein 12A-like [Mya arenaria]XP_052803435.1 heat shock 70 kDa protein 12A-like [Mya arenaria]XP_052803442.1 heat shock 70 kDa protein 12A-like [Mya arenaria]